MCLGCDFKAAVRYSQWIMLLVAFLFIADVIAVQRNGEVKPILHLFYNISSTFSRVLQRSSVINWNNIQLNLSLFQYTKSRILHMLPTWRNNYVLKDTASPTSPRYPFISTFHSLSRKLKRGENVTEIRMEMGPWIFISSKQSLPSAANAQNHDEIRFSYRDYNKDNIPSTQQTRIHKQPYR